MDVRDLPRKLKSRGYKPDSPIEIVVPAAMTPAALARLSSALATAGFQRVVFRKERRIEAYVNEKKQKR